MGYKNYNPVGYDSGYTLPSVLVVRGDLSSAVVNDDNRNILTLGFQMSIQIGTLDVNDFTVSINGTRSTVLDAIAASSTGIDVTFTDYVQPNDIVTISYSGNSIVDLSEAPVSDISHFPVTNNVTAFNGIVNIAYDSENDVMVLVTLWPHALTSGDYIQITGTSGYDAIWHITTIYSATSFLLTTGSTGDESPEAGFITQATPGTTPVPNSANNVDTTAFGVEFDGPGLGSVTYGLTYTIDGGDPIAVTGSMNGFTLGISVGTPLEAGKVYEIQYTGAELTGYPPGNDNFVAPFTIAVTSSLRRQRTYTPYIEYHSSEQVGEFYLQSTIPIPANADLTANMGYTDYFGSQNGAVDNPLLQDWQESDLPTVAEINAMCSGFDHGPYESSSDQTVA
jgi:hypothetical protein